jgi:hypothetical protein
MRRAAFGGNAMPARVTILTNKNDIPAMKLKTPKPTDQALADALFDNFITYAAANWQYLAQPGAQKAEDALNSDGPASLACGTIREALKIMFKEVLGLAAQNEDINGYFISKPGLKNFDSRVTGNLFSETGQVLGAHFSTHYFLKCGSKWYDPCLMASYATKEGPIHAKTQLVGNPPIKSVLGLKKSGSGHSLTFFKMEQRAVPGFGSVWKTVKPKDLKAALTKLDWETAKLDPDVKNL